MINRFLKLIYGEEWYKRKPSYTLRYLESLDLTALKMEDYLTIFNLIEGNKITKHLKTGELIDTQFENVTELLRFIRVKTFDYDNFGRPQRQTIPFAEGPFKLSVREYLITNESSRLTLDRALVELTYLLKDFIRAQEELAVFDTVRVDNDSEFLAKDLNLLVKMLVQSYKDYLLTAR